MKSKKIGGIILLLIGGSILLDEIQLFENLGILGKYWPLFIIAAGLYTFSEKSIDQKHSLIIIALGIILQLKTLNRLSFISFSLAWPLLLIYLGYRMFNENNNTDLKTKGQLDIISIFSGVENKNLSNQFKNGKIFVLFGGAEIDLTQTQMQDCNSEVDIFCMFGGVEIKVSDQWNVQNSVFPIFGGVDNKIENKNDNQYELLINGFTAFGGVEVYRG